VGAACRRLAQETAGRLGALAGLPPLSTPEFSAPQMVAMPIPPCDPQAVHDALLADYGIEIPVLAWQGRHLVRLSVQGYNTPDDMDALVDALGDLLALGASPRKAAG
jgi:isopenicillin-N epimerase